MIDDGCEETIRAAWLSNQNGTEMFQVSHKLKECKITLGEWNWSSFGSIRWRVEDLKCQIQQAEILAIEGRSHENLNSLRRTLNSLLEKDEKMWKQRSWSLWLTEGNRNTKYFHTATQCRCWNYIQGLRDDTGV